jgi:hypothetical protein
MGTLTFETYSTIFHLRAARLTAMASQQKHNRRIHVIRRCRSCCAICSRLKFSIDHTMALRPLSGCTLTTLRAGLALNMVGWPVKGLMPSRALVAGL